MNLVSHLLVGTSLLLLVAACGGGKTADEYLLTAQAYYDDANLQSAEIEVKNALRLSADNASARLLLGDIYFQQGDLLAAEKELQRAQELGATPDSTAPILAEIWLGIGKYDEVLSLPVTELAPEQLGTVLAAQAVVEASRGATKKSRPLMNHALERNPQSSFVLTAAARLFAISGELDKAKNQLNAVLESEQAYAPAWILQGDIALAESHLEVAEEAYDTAVKYSKKSSHALLKRASARSQMGDLEGAQSDVTILLERAPKDPRVNYLQGLIFFHGKKFEESVAALNIPLRNEERFPNALLYAAAGHWFLGNSEQASDFARKFNASKPDNVYGFKLLAAIALSEQRYSEAEDNIRPVIDFGEADVSSLGILAEALLQQNKMDEAIDVLQEMAALEPGSAAAQSRLAMGYMMEGDKSAAMEYLDSALQLDPSSQQAAIFQIYNYLNEKDFNAATQAAQDFVKQHPDSSAAYNLLGRTHLLAGRNDDAAVAFEEVRRKLPGNQIACSSLAFIAISSGDNKKARDYYSEVLEYHPNDLNTLLNLAVLDRSEGDEKSMVAQYERAIAAHPSNPQPRLKLARYYLAQGRADKVVALVNDMDELYRNDATALEIKVLAQLVLSNFTAAAYSANRLVKLRPESSQAHLLLAKAHGGQGDIESMESELEKAVDLDPQNLDAQLALARVALTHNDMDKAEQRLTSLNTQFPEHPDVMQLEGSMASMRGDQQQALLKYGAALEKSPNTQRMLIVARQRWLMGDISGAQSVMEDWLWAHPKDVAARLALADILREQNKTDKALAEYRAVVQLDRDNDNALNKLAWLLRDTSPEEALNLAQRAVQLNPGSAYNKDTLAVILFKTAKLAEAKGAIADALDLAPGNLSIQYHSAMINASAGNRAEAASTLTALLAGDAVFPEREKAEILLDELQAQ